jgi:hypothetical protein
VQSQLNRVEEATDFNARIVGVATALDRDRKQMRSSFPPKLSRLVARKPGNSARHRSNGRKLSANREGMD